MELGDVEEYTYNFGETPEILNYEFEKSKNYKRTRFALNTGYSYRLAKIADNIPAPARDYYKSLKSGCHLGFDISFFTSETLAFGLKYNLFTSSSNNSYSNKESSRVNIE